MLYNYNLSVLFVVKDVYIAVSYNKLCIGVLTDIVVCEIGLKLLDLFNTF